MRAPSGLCPWLVTAALLAAGCPRSQQTPLTTDAGPSELNPRDVLCVLQPDGCLFCDARELEATLLDPDDARPTACDPDDAENCVEFCTKLAPSCATPWSKGPSCLLASDLEFRRATFERDTAKSPEVIFAGKVVDEAGKRLEGARVRVWLAGRAVMTPLYDEMSAKDGTFKLRLRLGQGAFTVRVSHPGHASDLIEKLQAEKIDPRPTAGPKLFRLPDEVIFRGKVVDADTGDAVAEAVVEATRSAEDAIAISETRTAADGTFALGGLEARRSFVRVAAFGRRPWGPKPFTVGPQARTTVKLERANVIRGVVLDADGDPVPNATVAALLSGAAGAPNLPIFWTTDGNGAFAQDRFAAGPYYIWARRRDMLVYPPEKVELGDGEELEAEVKLKLDHKGSRVSGVVRARQGAMPTESKARVVLQWRSPLAFPRPLVGDVGPDGRFEVNGLLPGRYEISVHTELRPLAIVAGPRAVDIPIDPASVVNIEPAIVVRVAPED